MAAPVLTAIGPSAGRTIGGYVVYIQGANFRETPDTALTGYVGGAWPETVSVSVDGAQVSSVEVLGSDLIRFVMPAYIGAVSDLPKEVDVQVSNLDDDGLPIAGETTTATEWFKYSRKKLSGYCHSTAIDAAIILSMRRGLIDNVDMSSDYEYVDDSGLLVREVKRVELPRIEIEGPSMQEVSVEPHTASSDPTDSEDSGEADYKRETPIKRASLDYDVVCFSGSRVEVRNLSQAFEEWIEATRTITVPIDPSDAASDTEEYEIGISQNGHPQLQAIDGLHQWRARFTVDDVRIMDAYDVSKGYIVNSGDAEWDYGFPYDWLTVEKKTDDA